MSQSAPWCLYSMGMTIPDRAQNSRESEEEGEIRLDLFIIAPHCLIYHCKLVVSLLCFN